MANTPPAATAPSLVSVFHRMTVPTASMTRPIQPKPSWKMNEPVLWVSSVERLTISPGETLPRTPVPAVFRWSVSASTVPTRECDSAMNRKRYPATKIQELAIAVATSASDQGSSVAVERAMITSSMTLEITHGSRIQAVPETLSARNPRSTREVCARATCQRYRHGVVGMSAGEGGTGRSGFGFTRFKRKEGSRCRQCVFRRYGRDERRL